MSATISISDQLYARLRDRAQRTGHPNIESLLESLDFGDENVTGARKESVRRILQLRAELRQTYRPAKDSAEIIREDRER